MDQWQLLNFPTEDILKLRSSLVEASKGPADLPQEEAEA